MGNFFKVKVNKIEDMNDFNVLSILLSNILVFKRELSVSFNTGIVKKCDANKQLHSSTPISPLKEIWLFI